VNDPEQQLNEQLRKYFGYRKTVKIVQVRYRKTVKIVQVRYRKTVKIVQVRCSEYAFTHNGFCGVAE
jgi:hypothetical protein